MAKIMIISKELGCVGYNIGGQLALLAYVPQTWVGDSLTWVLSQS